MVTQEKITIKLGEINQKVLAKEVSFKRCRQKGKTIQTKQDIPKKRKKILPSSRDEMKTYQQPKCKRKPNDITLKYDNEKHNEKVKRINNMTK